MPDSFITKELYPKEELEVSFYLSTDQDKVLDLFSTTFNYIIGLEDEMKGE